MARAGGQGAPSARGSSGAIRRHWRSCFRVQAPGSRMPIKGLFRGQFRAEKAREALPSFRGVLKSEARPRTGCCAGPCRLRSNQAESLPFLEHALTSHPVDLKRLQPRIRSFRNQHGPIAPAACGAGRLPLALPRAVPSSRFAAFAPARYPSGARIPGPLARPIRCGFRSCGFRRAAAGRGSCGRL